MYSCIKQFCATEANNGLFLLDMPTGFGKTYSVLSYIFEASLLDENKERKFFFITPLKKNLPIDDLRDFFAKANKLQEFEEKVLFIDSTSESVLTFYTDDIAKTIPVEIRKTEEFKNYRQEVEFLQKQLQSSDPQIRQMSKGIERNFRERTEPAFRRMIAGMLSKRFATVKERLYAIKTDNEWKWVGILYPAVFTQDKQIIFMSMDKFLSRNATIVEPSYQFYNNKIIDNAIIFIDEFDSTKETMLKNIIQNGLRDKIDFIELFRSIYAAMETNEFPAVLTTPSEQRKRSEYNSQSLEQVIADTRTKAKEIYDFYTLRFSHRTTADAEDSYRNFLFQDHQFHSILNGNNKYITAISDPESCINAIRFTSDKPDAEAQNIHVMLGKLRGFVQWFQGMVNILAINYRQLKNERRQNDEDEFTQEQAIRTVLSLFHLGSYETDYLTTQVMMASRKGKGEQIAGSEFDRTVYEHGFRYYSFENDASHDMQSQIMMCSFQNTPEKLLFRFCERAKVIGISATATVSTVIGNFDLDYLRRKMQGAFYQLSQAEHQRLKQDFCNSQSGYQNVTIHTELFGAENYSKQTWISVFDNQEIGEWVYNQLNQNVLEPFQNSYNKERYVRFAMAFKAFLQHDDIKSMLCLLTKHPASNDRILNDRILSCILNLIAGIHPKEKNPYLVFLKGEKYDRNKDEVLNRLAKGEKLFVISTYQTIGAGQNLQYPIPSDLAGKLIHTNPYPPRAEKDFDAVYLDKPTNLLVNFEDNWQEESFVKYLFQIEFLQENAELSIDDALKHIRTAFGCYASGNKPQNIFIGNLYEKQSVRMYATRAVIQAIGRICRTNQKNPNIYIFADSRIADNLDLSVVHGRILNNEFMALVQKIADTQSKPPVPRSPENKANLVSNRSAGYIDNMLRDGWTESKMKNWRILRQLVLTFPTVSAQEAEQNFIFKDYYVKLPEKSNTLYFEQEEDYRKIHVSFTQQFNYRVEDESGTRLDKLMQWQMLFDYFQEQGYATTFVPNDFIMSPTLWNNIYKGALGEEAGFFWFKTILDVTLEEITDPELFELFDYKVPEIPIYVDFKNWDETTDMDLQENVDKIVKKAEKCGCKCVIIANLITQRSYPIRALQKDGVAFLIIPSLLKDHTDSMIDGNAVQAIRRCLNEYAN